MFHGMDLCESIVTASVGHDGLCLERCLMVFWRNASRCVFVLRYGSVNGFLEIAVSVSGCMMSCGWALGKNTINCACA